MKLNATLTKENFWNEVFLQYPKATKLFCNWVDEYKKAVNWNLLFNETYGGDCGNGSCGMPDAVKAPKFHDLPYAFQQGIWIEFVNQTLEGLFEQPEYVYSNDLEEDIKSVLNSLELLIEHGLDGGKEANY